MNKLAGKVAIITGSSAGIGRATALLFAQEGASVTIHGRNEKSLQETQNQLKAQGVQDNRILVVQGPIEEAKTCENLVDETIKKFGKLDVLVNNAGIGAKPGLDTLSLENFDYTFDVNLKSVVRLIQLSTLHLEKTQGNIVNVSSIAAIRTSPNPFYSSAKAALDHLSRGYSLILAPKGIRINVLNPGAIDTEFGAKRGLPQEQYDKFVDALVKTAVPMNRIGTAEEMAKIILFLAVDATYMTGDNIIAGVWLHNLVVISLESDEKAPVQLSVSAGQQIRTNICGTTFVWVAVENRKKRIVKAYTPGNYIEFLENMADSLIL